MSTGRTRDTEPCCPVTIARAFKIGFIDGLDALDLTLDTIDQDHPDINRADLVNLLRQWADETRTQIRAGIQ